MDKRSITGGTPTFEPMRTHDPNESLGPNGKGLRSNGNGTLTTPMGVTPPLPPAQSPSFRDTFPRPLRIFQSVECVSLCAFFLRNSADLVIPSPPPGQKGNARISGLCFCACLSNIPDSPPKPKPHPNPVVSHVFPEPGST